MAYLGNTPTQQAFTPAIDYFNGNASTTAFTLSRPVASVAQVQVTIDNVAQNPSSAYTVSGNTITFTSAPLLGTNNIYVYYTSPITQVITTGTELPTVATPTNVTPAQGATSVYDPIAMTGTAYYALYAYPQNSSQWQISTSPIFATTAYDSGDQGAVITFTKPFGSISTNTLYYWRVRYRNAVTSVWSNWSSPTSFTTATSFDYAVQYLVVAGGGGGGAGQGGVGAAGGGGAGGLRTASGFSVSPGSVVTVTVGAGGANSTAGNNSVFSTITSTGGGRGGGASGAATTGGSGGGGRGNSGAGAAGTAGQGTSGASSGGSYGGCGGGGASVAGTANSGYSGGAGGSGTASSITGSSVTYGGGGGGAANDNNSAGAAGAGGGGVGGVNTGAGNPGTANTGGGGGGGGQGSGIGGAGGAGGSGVVIISVPTANYSGTTTGSPTVTTSGSNTILKFTASGTYTT